MDASRKVIPENMGWSATWLRDESKRTTRKFTSLAAAKAAAQRAYEKAKANGEQTVDRFYLQGGGETCALFLEG